MKLSSMIAEIRYQLNDIDGLGYSDELLTEFINDALCLVYALSPEEFTVTRVIKASDGMVQCLGECCDKLISIEGQSDACGNIIAPMRSGNVHRLIAFNKKIKNKIGFTYTINSNVSDQFLVYPPVPKDEDVYFLVVCTESPSIDLDGNLPDCKFHQAILHYVFYRAHLLETESATSQAIADKEYNRFIYQVNTTREILEELLEDAASK